MDCVSVSRLQCLSRRNFSLFCRCLLHPAPDLLVLPVTLLLAAVILLVIHLVALADVWLSGLQSTGNQECCCVTLNKIYNLKCAKLFASLVAKAAAGIDDDTRHVSAASHVTRMLETYDRDPGSPVSVEGVHDRHSR